MRKILKRDHDEENPRKARKDSGEAGGGKVARRRAVEGTLER